MMDPYLLAVPILFVFGLGVAFGWQIKSYPSESEMLEQLIVARTRRLLLRVSESEIENEIKTESEMRVAKATTKV